MKISFYSFLALILSVPAFAQNASDVPPLDIPVPAAEVATEENSGSVFDGMMETLFGSSSLPEPEGSLQNEVETPAPLFSTTETVVENVAAAVPEVNVVFEPVVETLNTVQAVVAPTVAPRTRSKVTSFDISGIKLKMTPKEVFTEALANGFAIDYMDKTYANFIKWKLEQNCMDAGVYIFERKKDCITENAKKTGDYYINYMEFSKNNSKEKIRAFFTSSFSGNKLYRVTYYNEGDSSLGDSSPSMYLKDKRRAALYNWVIKKYGQPTFPGSMTWGDGGDAPYFQAFSSGAAINFNLTLEDPMMPYEDSLAMKKADVENVSESTFSF